MKPARLPRVRKVEKMLALIASNVVEAEKAMLAVEQTDCPVFHNFGPGIYIREVHAKAGSLIVGHHHKYAHTNVLLKGRMLLVSDNGILDFKAPHMFVWPAGRKIAYFPEDMIFQNIYATELTDLDEIENHLVEKSEAWQENAALSFEVKKLLCEVDRAGYPAPEEISAVVLDAIDPNVERVRLDSSSIRVCPSPISGQGIYAQAPVTQGDVICPIKIANVHTQFGAHLNHSLSPTAMLISLPDGGIDLVALRDLDGCRGGDAGTELTVDYRFALSA